MRGGCCHAKHESLKILEFPETRNRSRSNQFEYHPPVWGQVRNLDATGICSASQSRNHGLSLRVHMKWIVWEIVNKSFCRNRFTFWQV